MDRLVDVLISVDAETAKALESPEERAAMGRLISQVLRARAMRATLAGASLGAKVEVQASTMPRSMRSFWPAPRAP
jgi:hypothetical protein